MLGAAAFSSLGLGLELRAEGPPPSSGLGPFDDIVVVPGENPPPSPPWVRGATLILGVKPAQVAAVLADPSAWRAALPALTRADVIAAPGPGRPGRRRLSFEVEIPFFNLSGTASLVEGDGGADVELVEGAFAPGWLRFRWTWDAERGATVLTCDSRLSMGSANWLIRRLSHHDPWAEAAMAAAANWLALRAIALEAGAPVPRSPAPPRPVAPILAPDPVVVRGDDLLRQPAAALPRGVVLRVRRRPDGRLSFVTGLAAVPRPSPETRRELASPESWRVFPGWKTVRRRPEAPRTFEVRDNIAFVDLDATWFLVAPPAADATAPALATARATEGDTAGAVLRWDVAEVAPPLGGTATAIALSMQPRLDASGFIPRRLIAAEPLLEHALALGLVYADVAAVAAALARSSTSAGSAPSPVRPIR